MDYATDSMHTLQPHPATPSISQVPPRMTPRSRCLFTLPLLLVLMLPIPGFARPLVAVSVPPLAWLVDQLAGDAVDVLTLVPPGRVPESAQLLPQTLLRLQQADLVLIVGHPDFLFESRHVLPNLPAKIRRVDLYGLPLPAAAGQSPEHTDPHLWTSPRRMRLAAQRLADELVELLPRRDAQIDVGLERVQRGIDSRMATLQRLAATLQPPQFVVYHPAWGAFAADLGLRQVAIEADGKSPGPARMTRLLDELRESGTQMIIASPGHEQRKAGQVARELGARLAVVDPLSHDWYAMLDAMHRALVTGVSHE